MSLSTIFCDFSLPKDESMKLVKTGNLSAETESSKSSKFLKMQEIQKKWFAYQIELRASSWKNMNFENVYLQAKTSFSYLTNASKAAGKIQNLQLIRRSAF